MSKSSPKLNDLDDIKDHLDNTLIEFFYLFGIDPELLKLSDFNSERKLESLNDIQLSMFK